VRRARLDDKLGVGKQLGELGRPRGWRVHVELTREQQGRWREVRQRGAGGVGVEGALGAKDRGGLLVLLGGLSRLT